MSKTSSQHKKVETTNKKQSKETSTVDHNMDKSNASEKSQPVKGQPEKAKPAKAALRKSKLVEKSPVEKPSGKNSTGKDKTKKSDSVTPSELTTTTTTTTTTNETPVSTQRKRSRSSSTVGSKEDTKSKSNQTSESNQVSENNKVTGEAKSKTNDAKKNRNHDKKTIKSITGIGIGPPRVKSILTKVVLNPLEAHVREAILEAAKGNFYDHENVDQLKSKEKKSTKDTQSEKQEVKSQSQPIPVSKIKPEYYEVVQRAEKLHEESLRADYERNIVSKFTEEQQKKYSAAKKLASASADFNLRSFNTTFKPDFYNEYEKFRNEKDTYTFKKLDNEKYVVDNNGTRLLDKDGKPYKQKSYNEWTRAAALINKPCTRLSFGARNIIASFLDLIVEQYTRNALHNCFLEKRKTLYLHHALIPSEGFNDRVPLDNFVKTFDSYNSALDWIELCKTTKAEFNKLKSADSKVGYVRPEFLLFQNVTRKYDCEGYINELCRYVKSEMYNSCKQKPEGDFYKDVNVGKEFKRFCSYIVYEAILRIGSALKENVNYSRVKTINDEMVYHILKLTHRITGVDCKTTMEQMEKSLKKFNEFKKEHKNKKQNKKEKEAQEKTKEDQEDQEDQEED